MEALNAPNAARIILEAVRLTQDVDITTLRQLTTRNAGLLNLDLILRILLTFLPESTDPALYTPFLQNALTIYGTQTVESTLPCEPDEEANHRVRKIHLLPLADPQYICEDSIDSFTLFILHQAHKIDAETGSLNLVLRLIDPFIQHSDHLRTWAISTFLPLFRLDYEYYPHDDPSYSLDAFEALNGNPAITALLSKAAQSSNEETKSRLERDLRCLVGPWMYGVGKRKRRKSNRDQLQTGSVGLIHVEAAETDWLAQTFSCWAHVNEWLLDLAGHEFSQAVEAFSNWDGPRDVDYGQWGDGSRQVKQEAMRTMIAQYAQTGLGAVYAASHCSLDALKGSHQILQRVAKLMDLSSPPDLGFQSPMDTPDIPLDFLDTITKGHLLYNSLSRAHNPFTTPTNLSLRLSYLLLESSYILGNLGSPTSCKTLAELSLFGNEAEQTAELHKVLYELRAKPKDEEKWNIARKQIRWLRDWNCDRKDQGAQPSPGVFSRVKLIDMEEELLTAFLNSNCYNLAIDTYCTHSPTPIPTAQLEKTIIGLALASYDGASNGNRTRGGVRKASEIIMAFRNHFPGSESFNQVLSLISATHAMSFYSLTLQHGVPFQPVNIRAHKDPVSLVGKILDQNIHSYTKLDDLLEIGQDLASAGITHSIPHHGSISSGQQTLEQQRLYVKRRITSMAIEAALTEDDFETAYSYAVNRLSPPDLLKQNVFGSPEELREHDDISWRAAYKAGRHRVINEPGSSTFRRLEQCMELLSQALLLAPPSALAGVLAAWCQCEEDMNALIAREAEAEEKWDDKGDRRVPGGFSSDNSPKFRKPRDPHRNALNEEVPMGLFDVARGAAAALSKNAFPLRGNRSSETAPPLEASHQRPLSGTSGGGSESSNPSGMDPEGRVRKRDMVSNMVTGGLASGIGWVIGAPPVRQE